MRWVILISFAILASVGHCQDATPEQCASKDNCNKCLYLKNVLGGYVCEWCRNVSDFSASRNGNCYAKDIPEQAAALRQCEKETVPFDNKDVPAKVSNRDQCLLITEADIMTAGIAGICGGLVLAIAGYICYRRNENKKQAKLKGFRQREADFHKSRKFNLDKEMAQNEGGRNQRRQQTSGAGGGGGGGGDSGSGGGSGGGGSQQQQRQMQQQQHAHKEEPKNEKPVAAVEMQQMQAKRTPKALLKYKCMSEGGLRVRAAPSTKAEKVGGIKGGTIITALDKRGDWLRVSRSPEGWCLSQNPEGSKIFLKKLIVEDDSSDEELDG